MNLVAGVFQNYRDVFNGITIPFLGIVLHSLELFPAYEVWTDFACDITNFAVPPSGQQAFVDPSVVPNYLDGIEFMAAEYAKVKVADVVAMDANVASLLAVAARMESIFAIGTGFFLLHTGLFVPFHRRGVPLLMLAFVAAIAVYSHTQFITRSGHPWLQGADVSPHVVDFLTTVRIVHGLACVVLVLLALASFLAPKPAESKSA